MNFCSTGFFSCCRRVWWSGFATSLLALLIGCAASQAYHDGQAKLADGQTEPGLAKLREAMDTDPKNSDYRRSYYAQREVAVNELLRDADQTLIAGDFAGARQIYDKIASLDPENQRITTGRERVATMERHAKALDAAKALGNDGDLAGC